MIFSRKRPPEPQSGPRIAPYVVPAVMLVDAAKALTGAVLCRVVYTALADKTDISAADLEELSNRLGRLAHERNRT